MPEEQSPEELWFTDVTYASTLGRQVVCRMYRGGDKQYLGVMGLKNAKGQAGKFMFPIPAANPDEAIAGYDEAFKEHEARAKGAFDETLRERKGPELILPNRLAAMASQSGRKR
jgi:hypothetical protein